MNMKKTIAGSIASIVAISAMATTIASAKEIAYAAIDKTINVNDTAYYANDDSQTFTQTYANTLVVSDTVIADPTATPTPIVADKVVFTFSRSIDDLAIVITDITTGVVTTYDSFLEDQTEYTLTADKAFAAAHAYTVKVSYDVNVSNSKAYTSEEKAQDANVDDAAFTVTTGGTAAVADVGSLFGLMGSSLETAPYSEKAVFSVDDDATFSVDTNGDKKSLLDDTVDAIAAALEARTKAKIILNFKDNADIDDSDMTVKLKVEGKTFTSTYATVDYDASSDTATFDWAAMSKAATSGTTLGDVTRLFDSIEVSLDSDDVDDNDDIVLKSITIKGEAENFMELSAGEAATDKATVIATTAPVVTAAATTAVVTAAATTAAASNPKTGNAPIALAVIPVAIAAAAIIAKKRG